MKFVVCLFSVEIEACFDSWFNVLKLDWKLSDESPTEDSSEEERDPTFRESVRCKVFLGFTSNLVSSGVRDTIRYLVQHHMVSSISPATLMIYVSSGEVVELRKLDVVYLSRN